MLHQKKTANRINITELNQLREQYSISIQGHSISKIGSLTVVVTIRDVNRVPGPEKTTRSRVSNYPKATPASASPLRNDRTAGTAGTV